MIIKKIINSYKLNLDYIPEHTVRKKRNWASFLLVFMSMQYVVLEGNPLSWPKMITMAISPLVLLGLKSQYFSRGFWLGISYWLTICLTSWLQPYSVNRISIWFTLPFILLFGTYHTLITQHSLSLKDFEKIILWVINIYILFLILQQLCYFLGIHTAPIINRWQPLGFKFQSLAIEPSYAARIIGAYTFAYLEILKLQYKKRITLELLWRQHRIQLILITYFFITLGSGTAWGVFLTLVGYLAFQGKILYAVMGIICIFILPDGLIEARDRLVNTFAATMTFNFEEVWEADQSAAYRVGVLFNFVRGFRPYLLEFWIGQGAYTFRFVNIGIIMLYGFISWLMQMLLFYVCCFRSIISYEVFFYIIFVTLCVGNVVNLWAIMMIFSTIKYFYTENNVELGGCELQPLDANRAVKFQNTF